MSKRPDNSKESIHDKVREGYAQIARSSGSGCGCGSSCCGAPSPNALAADLGYTESQLANSPADANMGLSCGNPTAIASLKPGETVLDLGSGGGFDVFIAAQAVGPKGRAIGVDMTPEMISKARRNVAEFVESTGLDNVEFRLGEIEHLPVADSSVDVIISNCVINLSPYKQQVWKEIARVLKPGGRVAVSDLALLRPLPKKLKDSVEALVGCVAGAVLVDETRAMAREAGLAEITLATHSESIEAMARESDLQSAIKGLPRGTQISSFVTSLAVSARKPR
ncbi:MAG: arsenite methyltransferase [Candidatus Brocadiia bacterium]